MKRILSTEEGESIVLGAPAPGRVLIKVDARQESASSTVALQTLESGAALPVHRVRDWDEVWFVHKGQGKATVAGTTTTVVPGATVYVPRQTWFGLRNTGTGQFQALVVATPAGLDGLYRELSSLGAAPDPDSLRRVLDRYGIEISTEAPAAEPSGGGRRERGRRRGRGRGRGGQEDRQSAPAVAVPESTTPELPPAMTSPETGIDAPATADAAPGQGGGRPKRRRGGRRHRRRGGRGGGGQSPASSGASPAQGQAPESSSQPAARQPQASASQPPSAQPQRPQSRPPREPRPGQGQRPSASRSARQGGSGGRGGRRFGRVKEVYMGGKWVRVSGDGPVVSSGHDAAKPEDDE